MKSGNIINYVKLMRPHHWLKNFIVFLPLFFNGSLFSPLLIKCLLGFAAFSFISSCVYVINDICDVEKDRMHSVKCKRPIAAGLVPVKNAVVLASFCGIIGIGCVAVNRKSLIIILVYLVLNLAYSFKLKHLPIIDVLILSSGFVFRLVLGSFMTGIEISSWLYLTVMMASLYFGFGKRRGEMKNEGTDKRKVLEHYTYNFLDKSTYMFLTLTVMFYSLWAISTDKILVWSVVMVTVVLLKYNLDIEKEASGDPIDVIISDKILMILALLYAAMMVVFIYFM